MTTTARESSTPTRRCKKARDGRGAGELGLAGAVALLGSR
jgi:hypothetical protein